MHDVDELSLKDRIKEQLDFLREDEQNTFALKNGNLLYINGQSLVLTQSTNRFEVAVDDEFDDFKVSITFNGAVGTECNCKAKGWCHHKIAGLLQVAETVARFDADGKPEGKEYTREGMKKRVLKERAEKAKSAKYRVEYADNVFGEHRLTNERGQSYKLTFRNLKKETGYCSCPDYKTNKLGTCKHLMFAFSHLKKTKRKAQRYPFVEIYLDPLNDYRISWFYPHELTFEISALIQEYFGDSTVLADDRIPEFLGFVQKAEEYKQILVRPEVLSRLEEAFDEKILENVHQAAKPAFSVLKAKLYPYQQEGIAFAAFRKGAIIADEMGLGKTIQAIGTALLKKAHFGFEKTLVICPASLKNQWKSEIEKFCNEQAVIVEGFPTDRAKIYREDKAYFHIVNYETVLRDLLAINHGEYDFVILDEAQRIKNFETRTATAIKSINKKHGLVITGTPIENKLIDLYAIVEFLHPRMLTPLWEFSYQHCYFDHEHKNKITGYYNLQELKERMTSILIRREKRDVMDQLNNITELDVPVDMHDIQKNYHASAAQGIASILRKKFKTPFDMQRITRFLQTMRMACDSSYLVDKETNHSPKLVALEEILLEKLDLHNNQRKVIIFSEWKRMNHIIGKMLGKNGIGFTELSSDVPVKNRHKLIKNFEDDPNCRVFVSTEAGGSGLNLQVADTVINFELPWNPAKKNQRIGRIDRLGQENPNLTVINLITRNSIEMRIASGLVVKQNLFDNVLNAQFGDDVVDFSDKGRAQFLQELEESLSDFTNPTEHDDDETLQTSDADELETVAAFAEEDQAEEQARAAADRKEHVERLEEMETVMKKGMDFLAGIFKMSTGKDLSTDNNKIEIDRETGEVVMRFKLD